jgi:hypothetical protein
MNATIRAHHLGLAPPVETAGQFKRKVAISLVILSMATFSMIWQDTIPKSPERCLGSKNIKVKARRAKRKIYNLFKS